MHLNCPPQSGLCSWGPSLVIHAEKRRLCLGRQRLALRTAYLHSVAHIVAQLPLKMALCRDACEDQLCS